MHGFLALYCHVRSTSTLARCRVSQGPDVSQPSHHCQIRCAKIAIAGLGRRAAGTSMNYWLAPCARANLKSPTKGFPRLRPQSTSSRTDCPSDLESAPTGTVLLIPSWLPRCTTKCSTPPVIYNPGGTRYGSDF